MFNLIASFFVTVFALLSTLFYSVLGILLSPSYQKRKGDPVVRTWCSSVLHVAGIPWTVVGLDNVPKEGGCLFLINHSSLLDIPLAHVAIPPLIRFGAKSELFRIPFFGRAMRRAGALEIVRQNRSAVMRVYDKAAARLRNGERFVLAPEGTRQDEEKLGNFKTGPFILAINAQVPVVPVVLSGVAKALPKTGWLVRYRGTPMAYAEILPAIATVGLSLDDRDDLRAQVYEQMKDVLARRQKLSNSPPHPVSSH